MTRAVRRSRSRTRSARTSRSLRTTLLPGLFRTLARNIGRGFGDIELFETGLVFRPRPGAAVTAPILATDRGPTEAELATLEAALPDQPLLVAGRARGRPRAARLVGARPRRDLGGRDRGGPLGGRGEPPGAGRAGRGGGALAPRPVRRALRPRRGRRPARDGGRRGEWLAGFAGELHPRVLAAYGLPPRSSAFELDFGRARGRRRGPGPGPRPRAVGLPAGHPGRRARGGRRRARRRRGWRRSRAGAGELLEDVRLFDVYTGAQLGQGRKSLAYTLRLRAPDRTLTAAEATAARDAAVAEAARRTGAVLRA